jgi:Mannosyltransferase (PIG-V)
VSQSVGAPGQRVETPNQGADLEASVSVDHPLGGAAGPKGQPVDPVRRDRSLSWMADLWKRVPEAVKETLPPFAVARVVVLGALGMAHFVVDRTHPSSPGVALRVHQGLLGWDAGWYETIARTGYAPLGNQSLRFFPALPLFTHVLAWVPGVHDGAALVVLANLAAFVATALLFVLARRELGDRDVARRSIWILSLLPSAFVLVMGYAESMLLLFAIGCFLALRPDRSNIARHAIAGTAVAGPPVAGSSRVVDQPSAADDVVPAADDEAPADPSVATALTDSVQSVHSAQAPDPRPHFGVAGVLACAAALTRPIGVLLALAVAAELIRWWPRLGRSARLVGIAAFLSPFVGLVAFLAWSRHVVGDWWAPLRVQLQNSHHGGLADPFSTLYHDATGLLHHHVGTALHVPWVLLALAMLVVCWRRLPAPYTLFAASVLAVAVSGANLDSFERYALSAFPLSIAAATILTGPRIERAVLSLLGAALAGYALLAFLNISVP